MEIAVGSKPSSAQRGMLDAHVAEAIAPGVVLLAVAEGFGAVRGREAPTIAAEAVRDALRRRVRPDGREARAALIAAFSGANARVFAQSGSDDDHVASGTSLTAALIVGDRAHIAHVGRTRAYLGRDGAVSPLTADDELDRDAWLRPRSNVPTEAVAAHLLTRTLGTQPTLDATVGTVRLMHGDALLLTTGSFNDAAAGGEVAYALRAGEAPEAIAQRALRSALSREGGGRIVVARASAALRVGGASRAGDRLRGVIAGAVVFALLALLASALLHALAF